MNHEVCLHHTYGTRCYRNRAIFCEPPQVLILDSMQRLALFLATDVLFAVTSYAFLLVGEVFGRERLETRPAEVYPGEFSNVNTKCRQIGLLSSASKEQDIHACCRAVEGTFRQKNNAKVLQDIPSGERTIARYLRRSITLARGEAVRAEGQPKCTI